MENADGTIETTDLGLTAYLYSLGAKLTGIDRSTPRRAVFTFFLSSEMAEGISKWQSGTAVVNALAFWTAYQQVKIELYNRGDKAKDEAERCRPTA